MSGLWFLLMAVLGVFAVVGAKTTKWKLLNLAIIVAFMAAGLGIGALMGWWGGNTEIGGVAAVPLMVPRWVMRTTCSAICKQFLSPAVSKA